MKSLKIFESQYSNFAPKIKNNHHVSFAQKFIFLKNTMQQCNVEFDEPTRHVSGMLSEQASSNNVPGVNLTQKSRIIVLNPQHKKLQVSCYILIT